MRWQVNIDNFLGGFAPAWYKETYPSYGNKNQAGSMLNIDLTNPGYMTQGPGLASLTNGTDSGAVSTLIKGILDFAVTSDTTYGVGGNKLYQIGSSTVTSSGTWPHTIDKAVVTGEDGEDVCYYKGFIFYSYNHSGSAGDIGKYDLASTFDDDWGSTVPSGAATLQGGVPHPMIKGGNDVMYIGNGRYVASYDGTTLIPLDLDLPVGAVIVSLRWASDKLWITANVPNISGSNKNTASVFIWDGTTDSWDAELTLMGTAGGSHVRNGVVFQFYQDISSSGGYKLAYIDGSHFVDIANYSGDLPAYYQITDLKDFIIWNSNGSLFAWGSGDKDLPVRLFQLADGGYTTVGGVVCPFGTVIVASTQSTSYKLAKLSGYDTVSNWKSLMFDVTGEGQNPGRLNVVRICFDKLTSGARVDWKLLDNQGRTIYSDIISFSKLGAATSGYYALNGLMTENFRVEFDYASGSTTAPVNIRNVKVFGTT